MLREKLQEIETSRGRSPSPQARGRGRRSPSPQARGRGVPPSEDVIAAATVILQAARVSARSPSPKAQRRGNSRGNGHGAGK